MKYRLMPTSDGYYVLQENTPYRTASFFLADMWSPVGSYNRIKTLKEAEEIIKNIEREPIYLGGK